MLENDDLEELINYEDNFMQCIDEIDTIVKSKMNIHKDKSIIRELQSVLSDYYEKKEITFTQYIVGMNYINCFLNNIHLKTNEYIMEWIMKAEGTNINDNFMVH